MFELPRFLKLFLMRNRWFRLSVALVFIISGIGLFVWPVIFAAGLFVPYGAAAVLFFSGLYVLAMPVLASWWEDDLDDPEFKERQRREQLAEIRARRRRI